MRTVHRIVARSCAVMVATGFGMAAVGTAAAQPAAASAAVTQPKASKEVERGRYIISIAGCNDCHTHGYPEAGGKIPESKWLTGDALGFRGPWGTTYPPNLRDRVLKMTEEQWVKFARTAELRPPMPWWALRAMTDADLRAVHRFIVSLGPAGMPAPAYVPPGHEPKPPFIQFPLPPK